MLIAEQPHIQQYDRVIITRDVSNPTVPFRVRAGSTGVVIGFAGGRWIVVARDQMSGDLIRLRCFTAGDARLTLAGDELGVTAKRMQQRIGATS